MSFSREEYVYLAKLADQAERYKDVIEFMEKVAITVDTSVLTVEERNLLFKAYDKVNLATEAFWKTISSIEQDEENRDHVSIIKPYRGKIETELSKRYDGILNLLDSHLVPTASLSESKVFYLTLKGDYLRYLTEFKTGAELKEAQESSLAAYMSAQDIALAALSPTDPTRLELAGNFSVFYYDNLKSPDRAARLAKQAYFDAFREQLRLGEEPCRDSSPIMERILRNLTRWESGIGVDIDNAMMIARVSNFLGRMFAENAGVSFPKPEPEEEKPAETGE